LGVAPAPIAVALATFDGAAHVEAQIRSLQAQDVTSWRLFVRDDGSTDSTQAIVSDLARDDPRIELLPPGHRLGPIDNFGALLAHARHRGAEYVFLCDQDDVWRPDKMSRALARMRELEALHGPRAPLLVHSDLQVVNDRLQVIHPSFLRYQGIRHEERDPLRVLLCQNFVTGCASVLNRALLDVALPFPEHCLMHDWWLAQDAAALGAIGFVPHALLDYRQHSANQVGATGVLGNANPFHAAGRRRMARAWRTAAETVLQSAELRRRIAEHGGASPDLARLVDGYARLSAQRSPRRLGELYRLRVRCQTPLRTALVFARIGLMPLRT
jgi:hypothetical protein